MTFNSNQHHDNCGFGLIAHTEGLYSHDLLRKSIDALGSLVHRGGIAADGKTGDGCGLLIGYHQAYFEKLSKKIRKQTLPKQYAIAMMFLSSSTKKRKKQQKQIVSYFEDNSVKVNWWREVPVDDSVLGPIAYQQKPYIVQVFLDINVLSSKKIISELYRLQKKLERLFYEDDEFYICSLSDKTVVYKGLMLANDLSCFYSDLKNPEFKASICIFHQRFSTNTAPQWHLAQPFRYLAHNGEINTIRGNRQWMKARLPILKSEQLPDIESLGPIVSELGSDSQSIDNMFEFLIAGGMSPFRALRLMIPPAWQNVEIIDPDLRAFYEYQSMNMEPWDGPAGIVLTDGCIAICALDRNGLRPTRWVKTQNKWITVASEIGVWQYDEQDIVAMGRVRPGDIFAIDVNNSKIYLADEVDRELADCHPYRSWLRNNSTRIESRLEAIKTIDQFLDDHLRSVHEALNLVSYEEKNTLLKHLSLKAQEATGSMGDDTPMAVFSKQARPLTDYFRQQFAQVTNPPIDSIRESIVMSLETCLGPELNTFEESPEHARRILLNTPVLSTVKYQAILHKTDMGFLFSYLSLGLSIETPLEQGLKQLFQQAHLSVVEGTVLLVLSDKKINQGEKVIPAVLAVGYLHQELMKVGLRCKVNILLETAQARDPHQFAVLIGVGATAIYPWLSYDLIHEQCEKGFISLEPFIAFKNYRQGIRKGIYKILSKMGISTIASYRGAQLFEVFGLDYHLTHECFPAMPNILGGKGYRSIDESLKHQAEKAWNNVQYFNASGLLKYMHTGEYHCFNPGVVQALQKFSRSGEFHDYETYKDIIDQRPITHIRDAYDLQSKNENSELTLDEIEPVEAIFPRFDTAAMSLGALSPEAHEALAEAMNLLGGHSNSGEGGEDSSRFQTIKNSKIKQIASGRFGVTAEYLMNAEILQIKIAQGAKPGEGGQLPGAKVNGLIAKLRFANPGVTLISPPPHHDIYSIEDLAQLIFDLKSINKKAKVSVKLVSSAGVGTIAAGVAKAGADLITISGYDGGTAASPISSIKHAGSAWELGLVEAHHALISNGFRDSVTLQVDGGLKTGQDIVKATILGADTFGFGTAPMVALGCKYLRICHLNNCATGVATQDQTLRTNHYQGIVKDVISFFRFLAEDVRHYLFDLNVKKLDELRGKVEFLTIKNDVTKDVNESNLNYNLLINPKNNQFVSKLTKTDKKNFSIGCRLNDKMLEKSKSFIEQKLPHELHFPICNQDRSVGARTAGYIAKKWGNQGLRSAPIRFYFRGHGGQSFGVWNPSGQHLHLRGAANDYVGKGMCGGEIIICPFNFDYAKPSYLSALIGNTCLYGATGGVLYAAGRAGERFAVRNSGAIAVIEGAGDHCCEYMTRGVVVVLGHTGYNFAAGMTGGLAYVLDLDRRFVDKYNRELVDIIRITNEETEAHRNHLRSLLSDYVIKTKSPWGLELFEDYERYLPHFWLVKPKAANLATLLETTRDNPE